MVAHDLHPDYLSTRYALEDRGDLEPIAVQHHHAHLAACLAEHGREGPAVGAIFDGTGYGSDGTVWGGELLVGGLADFERAGHLRPVAMPGGERAIREPWRMACAWLIQALDEDEPALPPSLRGEVDAAMWGRVAELAQSGLASPVTSSVGRLFDAVAALCGIAARVTYEGQAAIELEALADPAERGAYPFELVTAPAPAPLVLDPRSTVRAAAADLRRRRRGPGRLGALPQRSRRRHRRERGQRGGRPRTGYGGPQRRRLRQPPAARASRPRA